MKRTPLKRKTSMKRSPMMRGPSLTLRKAWIKRESDNRKIERQIYALQKAKFLKRHPWCEVNQTHAPPPQTRSRDVHHVKGRGRYYLDESTWLAACRECHDWIHSHANAAREIGLLQF